MNDDDNSNDKGESMTTMTNEDLESALDDITQKTTELFGACRTLGHDERQGEIDDLAATLALAEARIAELEEACQGVFKAYGDVPLSDATGDQSMAMLMLVRAINPPKPERTA